MIKSDSIVICDMSFSARVSYLCNHTTIYKFHQQLWFSLQKYVRYCMRNGKDRGSSTVLCSRYVFRCSGPKKDGLGQIADSGNPCTSIFIPPIKRTDQIFWRFRGLGIHISRKLFPSFWLFKIGTNERQSFIILHFCFFPGLLLGTVWPLLHNTHPTSLWRQLKTISCFDGTVSPYSSAYF